MDAKLWTTALGVVLATTFIPLQASALGGVRVPQVSGARLPVHMVADRRCTPRRGGRPCRNVEPRRTPEANQNGYGYSYGAPRPEFYPIGSSAWWQAMEREGRTGQGPE